MEVESKNAEPPEPPIQQAAPPPAHISDQDMNDFELHRIHEIIEARNQVYTKMISVNALYDFHRDWFDGHLPIKQRKYAATAIANPLLYCSYDASPGKDLRNCLSCFVDMHNAGLLTVDWQFGGEKRTKMNKLRAWRSFPSAVLKRQILAVMQYM